ncbi:hypothetical protein EDD98_6772 [Streptomyces sp. PanSC19]|nr:hypothetical protein EDD98_6772 [Streptomyces sp. PanSC19]
MDTMKPVKDEAVTCAHCGADVPQTAGVGRVKRYCTVEHGRLWRRHMRALGFPV